MLYGTKLVGGIALLALCSVTSPAQGQQNVGNGPQLFANQYTQGMSNQATARMYVAPVPVPEWVGHTYYTYQPLYPHELMYGHSHRYHSYYDNGRGLNTTSVHYYSPPVRTMMKGMMRTFSRPRP